MEWCHCHDINIYRTAVFDIGRDHCEEERINKRKRQIVNLERRGEKYQITLRNSKEGGRSMFQTIFYWASCTIALKWVYGISVASDLNSSSA